MVQLKLHENSLLQAALVLLAIKNDGFVLPGEKEIEGTSLLMRIVKAVIFYILPLNQNILMNIASHITINLYLLNGLLSI